MCVNYKLAIGCSNIPCAGNWNSYVRGSTVHEIASNLHVHVHVYTLYIIHVHVHVICLVPAWIATSSVMDCYDDGVCCCICVMHNSAITYF